MLSNSEDPLVEKKYALRRKHSAFSLTKEDVLYHKLSKLDDQTLETLLKLVPQSQTPLLLKHLGDWDHVLHKLLKHYKALLEHEKRLVKTYSSSAKSFGVQQPSLETSDYVVAQAREESKTHD